MESRIAVMAILVLEREASARAVQEILSRHSEIIVGRMGIPYRQRDLSVIAVIVDGTTDQIGALSGQLGGLRGVKVRTTMAPPLGGQGDAEDGL